MNLRFQLKLQFKKKSDLISILIFSALTIKKQSAENQRIIKFSHQNGRSSLASDSEAAP